MVKESMEGESHRLEAKLALLRYNISLRRSNAVTHTRWICGSNASTLRI